MPNLNFLQEHLGPIVANLIDLGSSVLRWRKIWTIGLDISGTGTITRTPTATTDIANKAYVDASPGAGATVEEADGTPSYTGSTTLRFDQVDGFVITQPSAGIARIDLAAIPNAALVAIGVATGGTGQTTYTKGDVLVASAATTLTKLAVGSDTQVLTADAAEATGVKWAAAGSTSLTVREVDTVPSYAGNNILEFDQADGFVITNPIAGTARVDITAIPSANLATVAIAQGGTGSTTAGGARTALDVPSTTEAILDTIVDAKGDLIAGTAADTVSRLAVGANDTVLTAASAEATGLKWAAAASSGNTTLNKVTADTTVGNTVTETTVYTFSVGGGTLSTANALRLSLVGIVQGQTAIAAVQSLTIRLKYGVTTVATATFIAANGDGTDYTQLPANSALNIIADLRADGATNAQVGMLSTASPFTHIRGSTVDYQAGYLSTTTTASGTAAIDSTAAANLVITVAWSVAATTNTYTMRHAILEKLA